MSRRRRSNRSVRLYAASTLFRTTCARGPLRRRRRRCGGQPSAHRLGGFRGASPPPANSAGARAEDISRKAGGAHALARPVRPDSATPGGAKDRKPYPPRPEGRRRPILLGSARVILGTSGTVGR